MANFFTYLFALDIKTPAAGIAGATVLRGVEGHGEANRLRTAGLLDLSTNLPVIVMAVDRVEKMKGILPVIQAMAARGLITLA